MTKIAKIEKAIFEDHDCTVLRAVMGTDDAPMTHAHLQVLTGIGRSTLQRWEQAKRQGRAHERYSGTVERYASYLRRSRPTILKRLRSLPAWKVDMLATTL